MKTVNFIKMQDGTAEEYAYLDMLEDEYKAKLADRLIIALDQLENTLSGYKVSRLEHCLQSATRMYNSGRSEQWVVAALIHDLGDELAPYSHSEMAAAILRPFVNDEIYWVVKHHGVFQMFYYAHHSGGNRNAREQFAGHPYYESAIQFCHDYDQNCFDPDYSSKSLKFFKPMLERVFSKPNDLDEEHQARYGASDSDV